MTTPSSPSPQAANIVNARDYEHQAQALLPASAWAYLHGGAGDEHTLTQNRQAWDALHLHPRVLRPLAGGHTRLSLLGRDMAHPILLAPVAYHRLAHPDGELGVAYAAAAQGAGMVLSTQASTRLEDVAQAIGAEAGRGPLWMQLYIQPDRSFTLDLIQRAEQAGYEALVITVDAPTSGARDRERRTPLTLPPGVSAVNLQGMRPPDQAPLQAGQSALFDGLLTHAPSWDDISWVQSHTKLPVLLKGVLHEDDARQARSLSVQGLIVSNHGGRTLDTVLPTAWALPRIAHAVGADMPVLVDGGIRRGTDVLKALALGAQAVLIGRPYVHALATNGAMGVAHVIRLLRDELEIAMALSGCQTLSDIHPSLIFKP
jgi:4-hydroxymandelate oxidase